LRLALWGGHRSLLQAVAELVMFVAVYVASAVRRERPLIAELVSALRGRSDELVVRAGEG
jgi:hypothetical protein